MGQRKFTSQEVLKELVGFKSVSADSNLDLIYWVRDYLKEYDIESTILYNEDETKANLFATVGPTDAPGIVLSGHTDVVPVKPHLWDTEPFTLTEKDGKLYGRGTSDMKSFAAVVLAKLPEMTSRTLKTPLHFAFSYDEEVGCIGVHKIVNHIKALPVQPQLCIVGEPTEMKIITGQKGITTFEVVIRGRSAHSSMTPYAVNAVESAAEVVAYIKSVAKRLATEGPFNQQFDPPFTTINTGVIEGGTACNVVPDYCRFEFEFRNIPETSPEELMDEIRSHAFKLVEPYMKDIGVDTGFEFKVGAHSPAFDLDNDKVVEFIAGLSGANAVEKVSFATEAGVFEQGGIPTVVCGPGNIAQAHKPNEFIQKDQLIRGERFIEKLIEKAEQGVALQ